MVESTLLISKSNTEYNICIGTSPKIIHIKGNDNDTNDFITVNVDHRSFDVQLFYDIVVEGSTITVMSKSLPNNSPPLALKFELIKLMPCELKWGVQSTKWQKIYLGLTKKTILIQGPQNQKGKNEKREERKKSIVVEADGQTSETVIEGSSTLATGNYIVIKASETSGAGSLTGKYTLLE